MMTSQSQVLKGQEGGKGEQEMFQEDLSDII